jgi:hypothetical protein
MKHKGEQEEQINVEQLISDLQDLVECRMLREELIEDLTICFKDKLSAEDVDNVAQFIWINYLIIKSEEETFSDDSWGYKQRIISLCIAPLLILLNTEDSREYCLKAVAAYKEYIQRLVEVPETEKDSRH